MCGDTAVVTSQLLRGPAPNARPALYAGGFFYTSITIMATVCPFSPSELKGDRVNRVGRPPGRHHCIRTPQRTNPVIHSILRRCGRTCTSIAQCRSFHFRKSWNAPRIGASQQGMSGLPTPTELHDSDLRNHIFIGPSRGIKTCQLLNAIR
jgi:hypothetical protein